MNLPSPEELFDAAVAEALAEPIRDDLTHAAAARHLVGLLTPEQELEVLQLCIESDEASELLMACARELEDLKGKADVDLKAAALEGGCRSAVAEAMLEVRALRQSVASGGRISFERLLKALRDNVVTRTQIRALIASPDSTPFRAANRDGFSPLEYSVEGGTLTVQIPNGASKGQLCVMPTMMILGELNTADSKMQVDLTEFPELAQMLESEESGLYLAIVDH